MPTLLRRRYHRKLEEVGKTEKVLGAFLLLLLCGIVAAYVLQVVGNKDYLFNVDETALHGEAVGSGQLAYGEPFPAEAAPQPEGRAVGANPFPDVGVAGWRRPGGVSRFAPDNLYEKINGRADAYLQFHVAGLTFGTYSHRSDPDRTIDVYWYDMGESLNAFGIYRSEAPPDLTPVPFGREGYQTSGAVFFCKGSSYVQVLPASEDEADGRAAIEIARRIEERIEESDDDLWAAAILPEARRVPYSLNYLASNAFGLDFLKNVFTAEYDDDAGRIKLFVHRAETDDLAGALLDEYMACFKRYGRVTWTDPDVSRQVVAGEVAGLTDVVFVKGRYLGGVVGAEDAAAARRAAVSFYDRLTGCGTSP